MSTSIIDRDYVEAKLYDCGGKLKVWSKKKNKLVNADWYVYYFVWDPDKQEMHQLAKRGKINYCKTVRERRKVGKWLVNLVNQMLSQGELNPFKAKENDDNKEPALTLLQHLEHYLSILPKKQENGTLRQKSVSCYTHIINLFIGYLWKNKLSHLYPAFFTAKHAFDFCDFMIADKKYSGVSFNTRKTFLSGFFSNLIDREIITKNPWKAVKKQKTVPAPNIPFTQKEKERIDKYLLEKHIGLYFFKSFIYYCGLRPAEITKLRISDIKLPERKAMVYGSNTKNSQQIGVDIPDQFFKFIVEYIELEKYPEDYYLFARGTAFFPGEFPIHPNRATEFHKEVLKKLGGFNKEQTLYTWRDTGACTVYNLFKDPYKVMRFLRHSNLHTTMIYLRSMGLLRDEEFISKMR